MTFWNGTAWASAAPTTTSPSPRRRARDLVATLIMVTALAVYAMPFGNAQASGTSLTLSPASGTPGTKVTASGSGFTAKTDIRLTWDGATAGMPTVSTNGSGHFRTTFKVPNAAAGSHSIGAGSAVASFEVTTNAIPATAKPTPRPKAKPVPKVTAEPTAAPAAAPTGTPQPTATPAPTSAPTPTPAPTATPTAVPTATTPPAGAFVIRCGTGLCLAGQSWNLYGASQLGGLDEADARATLAASAGLNTLRVVNFLDEHGAASTAPYDEARWQRVDRVIAAAGTHGLHVLLDLSTYRNLLWNAGANPYTTDWQSFLSFVATRRNTVSGIAYAADPTIAIVAFAGEVEPINTSSNTRGITTAQVNDFFRRTFGQWKALDRNHLTSSGGLLQLDWNSGVDWKSIFGLADSDVCAIHDYSTADETITTPAVAAYCASIGKPWITEEFGWEQSTGDLARSSLYTGMYRLQGTYHAAGVATWNLGTQVGGTTFDFNTGTPLTWNVVVANAP